MSCKIGVDSSINIIHSHTTLNILFDCKPALIDGEMNCKFLSGRDWTEAPAVSIIRNASIVAKRNNQKFPFFWNK